MRYEPQTMSRRDLRKCYSRFSLSLLLNVAAMLFLSEALGALLSWWMARVSFDLDLAPVLFMAANDISCYLPGLILFPLLLRKLPRAQPIPVDRLSLWELAQAALFCLGSAYLFSLLSSLLLNALSQLLGLESYNRVAQAEELLPTWLAVLSFVVIAPVLEELIFRGVLLRRLRGLGDVSAILLSALAFSLFHLNLYQAAYAFVLGMVFASIVLLTGSIRDTILMHMLINATDQLTGRITSDTGMALFSLFVYLSIGSAIAMFLALRKGYHMEPGPLPFHARDKRRACLKSVWFWVMLVSGFALSTVLIFW